MKHIQFHQHGAVDVLEIRDSEVPKPESGQQLVKVTLAGVNFIDIYHRRGQYQVPLPSGIGIEGIGLSEADERVFWLSQLGSYSQYVIVNDAQLTPIPNTSLTDAQLLPLLCQGMTAHYLVDSAYPSRQGEIALVTAAAGGVGLLLIQLLKNRDVTVIACASTSVRAKLAQKHGADFFGTYEQLTELVNEATHGKGVHVVYDSVGRDTFDRCLESLAPSGMYILYGAASGAVPPFDLMRLNSKSLGIRRPTLATYTASRAERERRLLDLIDDVRRGVLTYPDTKIYPLDEAKDAQELIESRKYSGKIGIAPWNL